MNRAQLAARFGAVTAIAAVSGALTSFVLGRVVAVEGGGGEAPALAASEPATSPLAAPARALTERQYLEGILGRNLFDQNKIGVEPEVAEGAEDAGATDLNVTLKGTVVAVPDAYSAAFILEDGKQVALAYGIGQTVLGAEILEIWQDRVKLQRGDGRVEWLLMDGVKEAPKPATAATATPSEEGIEQTGENSYVVSRSTLDEYLSDMEGLSRMARALLHRGADGEFDGYRLSAIRRGSPLDKLGIRNGDIIHSVNGQPLDSMQGAMQAFQSLQSATGLDFEVTRRGQPVKLNYAIK